MNGIFSAPREYAIAIEPEHSNIIKTYDAFFDGEYWHQTMEYIPLRLQDLLLNSCFSSEWIDTVFLQVVKAVEYMHALGIAHLDLKLSNVMVNANHEAKLIDFGSAFAHNIVDSQTAAQAQLVVGRLGPWQTLQESRLAETDP